MDDVIPFASRGYWLSLLLLAFARGMDFLSTWIATPNLVLEGNPFAKRLGWKWNLILNGAMIAFLPFLPLSATVVSTASLLVAARNFQSAWLMRSLGEEAYREWHIRRIQETPITLYLSCLGGSTLLPALIGTMLICSSETGGMPFAIGVGMVAYGAAVGFYTLLAIWRIQSAARRASCRIQAMPSPPAPRRILAVETCSRPPDPIA